MGTLLACILGAGFLLISYLVLKIIIYGTDEEENGETRNKNMEENL